MSGHTLRGLRETLQTSRVQNNGSTSVSLTFDLRHLPSCEGYIGNVHVPNSMYSCSIKQIGTASPPSHGHSSHTHTHRHRLAFGRKTLVFSPPLSTHIHIHTHPYLKTTLLIVKRYSLIPVVGTLTLSTS